MAPPRRQGERVRAPGRSLKADKSGEKKVMVTCPELFLRNSSRGHYPPDLGDVVGLVPRLELYPAAKGVPDAGCGVRRPDRLGVLASKPLKLFSKASVRDAQFPLQFRLVPGRSRMQLLGCRELPVGIAVKFRGVERRLGRHPPGRVITPDELSRHLARADLGAQQVVHHLGDGPGVWPGTDSPLGG